jgi:Ca2+-dependent lipid-binding protein
LPPFNLLGGSSDPYVTIGMENQKFVTTEKIENLNPVWNESFEFSLFQLPNSFEFSIYDWNETLADRLMGTVLYELKNIEFGVEYHEVIPMATHPTAKLQFSFLFKVSIVDPYPFTIP